jgi:hypothetical protein
MRLGPVQCVHALGIAVLVSLTPACGDNDTPGASGPASVTLGTGRASFETIPEIEPTLELVGGPQGGFHVFVSSRLSGLDVEDLTLRYGAMDVETGQSVGRSATILLMAGRVVRDGDGWVRTGDILILDDASPEPVRDRTLRIRVTASEADDGSVAEDVREVRIVDDVNG